MDVHVIDFDRQRKTPKLIYLGNLPRPYGISEQDTWSMKTYMAEVLANGLRMLVAYGHHVLDDESYEVVASKLEFYAMDDSEFMHYIDFSQDKDWDWEDDDWLEYEGRPGFQEYCEKSKVIDQMREIYIKECLLWLSEHWGELWD